MVKEGFPFVGFALFIAIVFAFFQIWIGVAIFVFITLFMAYFFRNPHRNIPTEPNIIVSPADGRVTRVEENENGKFISIFLSPLDVHVNRSPIAGKITKVDYIHGKKMPATSNNASLVNERNSLLIEGEKLKVTVTQIAGIVARRIVCWNKAGDFLERGQLFGLIKFSSRTDLQMPANVDVLVKIDDKVKGGETIIARIND
ncbi:MAG: phosphatidylserine decarboxylase family protein [Pyrinomonadaceae bacterium]|nr:phosphatidylserine decarboxylase family protein [Pyrinomonadaceae bacterium]